MVLAHTAGATDITGLRDDLKVRLSLEQQLESAANHLMIVSKHNLQHRLRRQLRPRSPSTDLEKLRASRYSLRQACWARQLWRSIRQALVGVRAGGAAQAFKHSQPRPKAIVEL